MEYDLKDIKLNWIEILYMYTPYTVTDISVILTDILNLVFT